MDSEEAAAIIEGINSLEAATGIDLDGDGDIGQAEDAQADALQLCRTEARRALAERRAAVERHLKLEAQAQDKIVVQQRLRRLAPVPGRENMRVHT